MAGGRSTQSTRITPEVKAEIARLSSFAPEHNLREVEAIEAAERIFGAGIPQVAVFDTAFHATMPPEAYVYPGPYSWLGEGIRRYGFHGISHQYVSRRAAEVLGQAAGVAADGDVPSGRRLFAGGGAGRPSVDTTMGFTPLEGLMMGTRSGSVDPGVLIHLVRHCGYRAEDLDRILNRESGLKGVSGISGDMREVEAAMRAGNERARLAFDIFVHRLCGGIGVDGGEHGRTGRAGVHGGNRGELGSGAVSGVRAAGMAGCLDRRGARTRARGIVRSSRAGAGAGRRRRRRSGRSRAKSRLMLRAALAARGVGVHDRLLRRNPIRRIDLGPGGRGHGSFQQRVGRALHPGVEAAAHVLQHLRRCGIRREILVLGRVEDQVV